MASSEIITHAAAVPPSFSQSSLATHTTGVGPPAPPNEPYWHLVSNTTPSMNVKFTDVSEFQYKKPWESETFSLAGRQRKVVERSIFGPGGIEGSFSALFHEKDLNNNQLGPTEVQRKIKALEDFWEGAPDAVLIDTVGNAWRIEILESLELTMLDDDHGRFQVSFDFVEV